MNKLNEALKEVGSAGGKELWITGRVDEGARQMIADSGWKIVDKADDRLMEK